jgi:hypothetical protein
MRAVTSPSRVARLRFSFSPLFNRCVFIDRVLERGHGNTKYFAQAARFIGWRSAIFFVRSF